MAAAPPPVRPIGVVLNPRRHSAHDADCGEEAPQRRHSAAGDISSQTDGSSGALIAAQWEKRARLYKTEICRTFEETGTCRYGARCQFAHTPAELRPTPRHPRYKTEVCRTYWELGTCPYGKRCCFIHDERAAPGALSGATLDACLSAAVHTVPAGREPEALSAVWPTAPEAASDPRAAISLRSTYIQRVAHLSESARASPDPVAMGVLRFLDD